MGGLGEYFDIDPTILRVFYILLSVFTACFPGVIAYLFMVFVIPQKPETNHETAK